MTMPAVGLVGGHVVPGMILPVLMPLLEALQAASRYFVSINDHQEPHHSIEHGPRAIPYNT